jgi:hypothetical protein
MEAVGFPKWTPVWGWHSWLSSGCPKWNDQLAGIAGVSDVFRSLVARTIPPVTLVDCMCSPEPHVRKAAVITFRQMVDAGLSQVCSWPS